MRHADKTVERLFAGLRDAEPSPGMQRRLLKAMEAREPVSPASPWRRLISPWLVATPMPLVCAVAFTACLTVSLIVAITVHRPRHAPVDVTNSADARQAAGQQAVAQQAPVMPRRVASPVSVRHPRARGVSVREQTQVAGYPAPPLPLTEQERLLLRLAHRGDAEDMAILNPETQAAQSAKATEQFQQFFAINATEMRSQSE